VTIRERIAVELALLRSDARSFVRSLIEWTRKRKQTRAFRRRLKYRLRQQRKA
jgi:hypothetical protein